MTWIKWVVQFDKVIDSKRRRNCLYAILELYRIKEEKKEDVVITRSEIEEQLKKKGIRHGKIILHQNVISPIEKLGVIYTIPNLERANRRQSVSTSIVPTELAKMIRDEWAEWDNNKTEIKKLEYKEPSSELLRLIMEEIGELLEEGKDPNIEGPKMPIYFTLRKHGIQIPPNNIHVEIIPKQAIGKRECKCSITVSIKGINLPKETIDRVIRDVRGDVMSISRYIQYAYTKRTPQRISKFIKRDTHFTPPILREDELKLSAEFIYDCNIIRRC